jgi:hypothetical protein
MEYLSLYDYLGKPAGGKLGQQVASAASRAGIRLESREVENPKYKGKILLYPKDFLDFYFREPEVEPTPTPANKVEAEDLFGSDEDLDDLPF